MPSPGISSICQKFDPKGLILIAGGTTPRMSPHIESRWNGAMNTSASSWMLHPLDCTCVKCAAWRSQHGVGCKCGLKSCWERQILLEEDETDELLPTGDRS